MATTAVTPVVAVDTVYKGMKAGSDAIDLYNKMVNQAIPWATFEKYIEELKSAKEQYSEEATAIVGEVQTLLMASKDEYKSSTKAVYRWCDTAAVLMDQFMVLFASTTDKDLAEAQLTLLTEVLEEGQKAMTDAILQLEASSKSCNGAAGKLTYLNAVLKQDFSKGSDYYEAAVDKVRTEAYAGAVAGAVSGPEGLAIAYSIAAGVVEGSLIPELDKAFAETQAGFEKITKLVEDA